MREVDDPEAALDAAARRGDPAALVRIVVALAHLARRHAPRHAHRWDALLAIADAWADGRATRDEVLAAQRSALEASGPLRAAARLGADGSMATRYGTVALASTFAATAEAERPSLQGLSMVSCGSELEVCLDAAQWALGETTALMVDALADLGGAFVPEADSIPPDRIRDVVRATLAELVRSMTPGPTQSA